MKKTVVIIIEVDMNNEQSKGWHKESDYFNSSISETLEKIKYSPIKNQSGSIDTDSEASNYKVFVQTSK